MMWAQSIYTSFPTISSLHFNVRYIAIDILIYRYRVIICTFIIVLSWSYWLSNSGVGLIDLLSCFISRLGCSLDACCLILGCRFSLLGSRIGFGRLCLSHGLILLAIGLLLRSIRIMSGYCWCCLAFITGSTLQ